MEDVPDQNSASKQEKQIELDVPYPSNPGLQSKLGTPYIYTTTGLGRRQNKNVADVYHVLAHMQNAPGLACNYFFTFPGKVQNMESGTKLTATDATDAKTPANSTSPRPESNGRRPGPGFGQKSGKTN